MSPRFELLEKTIRADELIAAKRDIFPALTKAQVTKLKHLTILTLATENRVRPLLSPPFPATDSNPKLQIISYSLLLSSLELPSIPALEDLLIDAFYSNVLTGRLDQKEARLEVISGVGRDVRPLPPPASDAMEVDTTAAAPAESSVAHSVPSLTASLTLWLSTIGTLLSSLDRHLAKIAADAVNDATAKSEQERAVLDMVNTVSTSTKEGKDKGGNTLGGGGGGGGGSTSWTRDMASGILGKLTGGGGGGSKGEDMDVDAGGSTASGRGVKSPSGVGGRTRKRGRM